MNFDKIRSVLIKILLGTLVATSIVAVGVILMGSVNDLFGRVIWTCVAGIFYVGVLLAILSTIPHITPGRKMRSSLFVVNSMLILTCASYLTTILSIWTVISGDLPLRVHIAYLVCMLGILYAKPLIDLEGVYQKIRPYIYANFAFIALACLLASIAIITPPEWKLWEGFLGRAIAASIVIDVTLSMVITVLYHLYVQQHPELRARMTADSVDGKLVVAPDVTVQKKPMNFWVALLIVVGVIFFAIPAVLGVLGAIFMSISNY